MPQAAIGTNFNQPADIQGHLFPQVTFNPAFFLDNLPNAVHFFFGQILDLLAGIDGSAGQNRK